MPAKLYLTFLLLFGMVGSVQGQNRPLDILLVIDHSASMQDEVREFANNFAAIVAELNQLDWRIGVISSDYNCLQGLIAAKDALQAEQNFKKILAGMEISSGYETPIQKAAENIGLVEVSSCPEGQWRRENTKLAVIFVSDEDESSSGMPFYFFLTYAHDHGFELSYNLRVFSLVMTENSQCIQSPSSGENFIALSKYTGGSVFDICEVKNREIYRKMSQKIEEYGR